MTNVMTDNPLKDALAFIPKRLDTVVWPLSDQYLATLMAPHVERIKARKAAWQEAANAALAEGYRPTHCEHGTQVVWSDDRDCCCGPCEDSLTINEEAEYIARDEWHAYCKRMQLFIAVSMLSKAMMADLPTEGITLDWVLEPLGESGPKF